MKCLLPILSFLFFACNSPTPAKQVVTSETANHSKILNDTARNIATKQPDTTKHYTAKDSITIYLEIGGSDKYSKQEFNDIIRNHPELTRKDALDPDSSYSFSPTETFFNSEVGQDGYYILYAYLLKQKNGIKKYAAQRKKLINLYENINAIFGDFEHGGTYFGHQSWRILGYVEYSVYLYKHSKKSFAPTPGFIKQKNQYIGSLLKILNQQAKNDSYYFPKIKKRIATIEKDITNDFYLQQTTKFQHEHYQYGY